jgi:hypothetical protein
MRAPLNQFSRNRVVASDPGPVRSAGSVRLSSTQEIRITTIFVRRSFPARAGRTLLLLLGLIVGLAGEVRTQETSGRPRVFLDCNGRDCNSQYFRTEIAWVNWVNDREVADVHVIFTSTSTGAGGNEYQLDLLGRAAQSDYTDAMRYQSLPTDTERERLDALTDALAIGLARFASAAGYTGLVRIDGVEQAGVDPRARVVSQDEVSDPWNLWVFRLNAGGNLQGESNSQEKRLNGGFNASRVTPTWKFNLGSNVDYNERQYDLEDGSVFFDQRTDWGVRPYLVYALSDRWSIGARGEVARMTRFNQDFRLEVTPALEYSFFPYEEATRHALTVSYRIGPAYRRYIEETLFAETAETRWEQSLELDLSERQPWGEAGASISASNFLFLPDTDLYADGLYNVSLNGNLQVRIIRGLSVELQGNIGWVQDQIYLSAGGVSDEERLLRLQQQQTDFQYGVQVGFSVQFGSIYNNVVNNRLNRTQGFGGFGRMRF